MQVRRKIFNTISSDKELAKALALGLFIKSIFRSSAMPNFTYKELQKITGLHFTTLKKRISKLRELGFAKFVGKKNCLVISSLRSHNKYKNVNIGDFENVKDIEKTLYAHILVEIQLKKEFVKQVILNANSPKKAEEHKKAKKIVSNYGYDTKKGFRDYGISYKTIARKMGVCLQTAFKIVKWAIDKAIIVKHKRQVQVMCYGYKHSSSLDCTFYSNSNLYYIYANTYSLPIAGTY